jgi:hypothetical protein
MKKFASAFLLTLLLALACLAQAPAATPPPPSINLDTISLPAFVGAGATYNQFVGGNIWGSAIYPVANRAGVYLATTADMFPVRSTINGRTGYLFQTSVRQSAHKVLANDGRNMLLFGAGAGYAFGQQATSSGTASISGVSADITVTYIRRLNKFIAVLVPFRALYMPSGWNPIAQAGIVWTPGGK